MSLCDACRERPRVRVAIGIIESAAALGVDSLDLATIISYETAGTFNPLKRGPITQWGQHRGLIQFGEPQAEQHGVDWNDPIGSQLGPNGAVVSYMKAAGVQPEHGLLDLYSAVNAGYVGRYSRTDENNGGAPGTVRDKVNRMAREGHVANAERHLKYAEACACLDRTSADPTVIYGDFDAHPCLRMAGLMAIDVYNNPFENVAPILREDYAKIDSHWDRLWERGISMTEASPKKKQQRAEEIAAPNPTRPEGASIVETNSDIVAASSGMFCRFYAPKEAEDAQGNPTCPPVLAFRGSEMQKDELRSLAVTLRLQVDYLTRSRNDQGQLQDGTVMARTHIFWPIQAGAGWESAVRGVKADTTPPERSLWEKLLDYSTFSDEIGETVRFLDKIGNIDLVPASDDLPDEFQSQIDAWGIANTQVVLESGSEQRIEPATPAGRAAEYMLNYQTWARYKAWVTLHYDEGGDWGANVTQAMGLVGDQYEEVKGAVDDAIAIAEARGNRLNITGHSLGGGLAQAAALYCHKAYPHIRLKCVHFNAAGLHELTAERMERAALADAMNFPMFAQSVAGELLTSVQTPGTFPLVWNIFDWQGVKIPSAVGVSDRRRGISPGPFPVGAEHSHDFLVPLPPYPNNHKPETDVPDGDLLPFILPVGSQNRFTSETTEFVPPQELHSLEEQYFRLEEEYEAARRRFPPNTNLMGQLEAQMKQINDQYNSVEEGALEDKGNYASLTPKPVKFPHIEAITGFADAASDFDSFVSRTVSYLIDQAGDSVSREMGDASMLERMSPVALLTRIISGLKNTTSEFSDEAGRMGELISLCLAYHPMDVGGSTFLRPPE